ncbi:ribonuclease H-like domain-containing protein, partial [Tanacetum coccineum]
MINCNPYRTPIDTEKKLGLEGSPVADPTLCRSLAGSLQYLTFTQPDLSYAVQQLCISGYARSTSGSMFFLVTPPCRAETSWIHNLLRELHTHFSQRPWSMVRISEKDKNKDKTRQNQARDRKECEKTSPR